MLTFPVFVPTFNNPTYLKSMVRQIARLPSLQPIIVIDGASTYPPMLSLLSSLQLDGVRVNRLQGNYGPRFAITDPEMFSRLPDVFCLTDPDLAFNPDMPAEFCEELLKITLAFRLGKAGLALDISEAQKMRPGPFMDPFGRMKTIRQQEENYWTTQIAVTSGGDPIYQAPIDTTFALYNKKYFKRSEPLLAVRVAGRFTCKHLPWYRDNRLPVKEEEFYRRSQKFSTYQR